MVGRIGIGLSSGERLALMGGRFDVAPLTASFGVSD